MIEAFDKELALKHADRKCRVCYGAGVSAMFLHGKQSKYRHERACACAITGFYDALLKSKALKAEGEGTEAQCLRAAKDQANGDPAA